jgi:hypothetical protein
MLINSDAVLPKKQIDEGNKSMVLCFFCPSMPTESLLCIQFAYMWKNKEKIQPPPGPQPTLKTKLIGKKLTSHTQKSVTDDLHAPQQNNLFKAFIDTNWHDSAVIDSEG